MGGTASSGPAGNPSPNTAVPGSCSLPPAPDRRQRGYTIRTKTTQFAPKYKGGALARERRVASGESARDPPRRVVGAHDREVRAAVVAGGQGAAAHVLANATRGS